MEYNLVEMWLRRDPIRWVAGAMAGLLAGAVAMCFAMGMATSYGFESSFPAKLIGTILLGPSATETGIDQGATVGWVLFESLCLILGVIYAHFVGTNSLKALLPMGGVWGIFSWIFIWNLFLQSFKPIYAAQVPSASVFPICILFGFSLASVSLFDRILRGKSSHA